MTQEEVTEVVTTSLWSHLLTVGGFVLAVFAIARLISEKKQPGNTIAWLLGIVLIPYVGVPLYLLLGGRKIQQLVSRKRRVSLHLMGAPPASAATRLLPAARAIVANGAAEPIGGNRLKLLTSGEDAFASIIAEIRNARHTINITTFILGREETGRAIIDALAERARAGVKVRLLLDGLGSFIASRSFCNTLREAGGEVVRFMPVAPLSTRYSANLRNHRKLAVFDDCAAIVGGRNLARDYMGATPWSKRFADFGALIHGPAVGLINEIFYADWSHASSQSVESLRPTVEPLCPVAAGTGELQVIASGPDVEGDPLYEGIVSLIQEAEHSVWIITPYFIPDEVLQRSLLVKARAGKDVTLMVPARSNHKITDYARRQYLRELHAAGARVLLYEPGMLHAKALVIDDRAALFGSANFDLRSLFVNFEIGIVSYSPDDVAMMRQWVGDLIRVCRAYTPRKRSPYRILSSLAEELSRLLAPLL
ncbi:phospholipase D-like domain-containing protein [Synoicihabitans lomoniglobus]|uniref:Phospholipase D-like domain-containing protein n=1 Tax=Synoicihabitans lomoniglobus TaxID=2909285 RepID=A0AAF0CR33_9BACT|nr:phospholipase D-like domain-containing protein [Opitutaceae bacterium LMO-M01]WED66519.1 phospholipase D-like domain-containing protein [Opitutaceae bacterium LMO-M01]